MRRISTWIVVGASWALWLGCLPYGASSGDDSGATAAYAIEDGWLAGDVPTVGAFDADAYEIETYGDEVTLHVGERGGDDFGWAMTRLRLDVDALATRTGTVDAETATGCSGQTHGDWDWDEQSADVQVTVEPGATEDERLVYFQADFRDGHQTRGGFTLRLR